MTDTTVLNVVASTYLYVGEVNSAKELPASPPVPFLIARDATVPDGLSLWIYDETKWDEKPRLICMLTDLPEFKDLRVEFLHNGSSNTVDIYAAGTKDGEPISVQISAITYTPTPLKAISTGRVSSAEHHESNVPKSGGDHE